MTGIRKGRTWLDSLAEDAAEDLDPADIRNWAETPEPDGGSLPRRSAEAFSNWIWEVWDNWTDDEGVTVEQVLQGAVQDWCGGRTFD